MSESKPYPNIVRKAQIDAAVGTFSHPWNPKSEINATHLSKLGGLTRSGVSIARMAPGKESFAYHTHHTEEEWIYILSACATAQIDGQSHELEAGDFVGFPTPSVAHNLANSGTEELVYMMGGENHPTEVADFPSLDRRMVKVNGDLRICRLSDGRSLSDPDAKPR